MSLGNNLKSRVELDQIQHGEEIQYQLRPRDAISQPRRYPSQDHMQTNADIIKTLRRKRVGKKGLITKKDSVDKGFDYRNRESNKDNVPSRNPPSDQAKGVRYS